MADNTQLSSGSGGDTIRDVDKGGIKTQVTILDVGGAGAESLFSVGQKLAVNSFSVVLASDQATIPVSNASLPLPTGASTAARQDTGNTSLASIDGKVPALGQALAASSVPVVLTAAQLTTLTPPAAITGFLLDNTFTARINTLGQKAMASSTPVVLASDQASIPVTQSAGPWSQNITQFGGSALSTGTGAGGAGIPRVTVSSDSSITANAGTNLNTSLLALEAGGNLALIKAKTDNLDTTLSSRLKPADTLAGVTTVAAVTSITNALPTGNNVIGHVIADAGSTTAITGTVAVSAASLPLPANAAQESSGNLATLVTLATQQQANNEQNAQIIKLLAAILVTLGNNGGGFVDPEEASSLSTLQ